MLLCLALSLQEKYSFCSNVWISFKYTDFCRESQKKCPWLVQVYIYICAYYFLTIFLHMRDTTSESAGVRSSLCASRAVLGTWNWAPNSAGGLGGASLEGRDFSLNPGPPERIGYDGTNFFSVAYFFVDVERGAKNMFLAVKWFQPLNHNKQKWEQVDWGVSRPKLFWLSCGRTKERVILKKQTLQ